MADKPTTGDANFEKRPPDPFVSARINNPAEPAPAVLSLSGLLGDSDREGCRRLYLNTALDYYVEFQNADVLSAESIGPDAPPFVGLDATRVTLKKDAVVDYVRTQRAAQDSFDVEATAAFDGGFTPDDLGTVGPQITTIPDTFRCTGLPQTLERTCFTCGTRCFTWQRTCGVTQCVTCGNATCVTCFGATCQTCNDATCQTCDQATCQTCNHATCLTCKPYCVTQGIACSPTRVLCVTQDVRCLTPRVCPTVKCA